MAKTEGTYIQVVYKNVFGYISTNSWPFFMIQRPTIREKCAWVRSNTWRDERPAATGLDRFFSVFWFFDKHRNWQPKKFRICATATGGPVFAVGFSSISVFFPVQWTGPANTNGNGQNIWDNLLQDNRILPGNVKDTRILCWDEEVESKEQISLRLMFEDTNLACQVLSDGAFLFGSRCWVSQYRHRKRRNHLQSSSTTPPI